MGDDEFEFLLGGGKKRLIVKDSKNLKKCTTIFEVS
jgi:hypothetical protein